MNEQGANSHALAHTFGQGVTVVLSNGNILELDSVPLRTVFQVADKKEVFRWRMEQYLSFRTAASNPDEKIWEFGRRIPYWNKQWIDALYDYCLFLLTESTTRNRAGRWYRLRRWWRKWTAKRMLSQLSVQDMVNITKTYTEFHDLNEIVSGVFGKDEDGTEEPAPPKDADSADPEDDKKKEQDQGPPGQE